MKKIFFCLLLAVATMQCSQPTANENVSAGLAGTKLPDGFYEVMEEGKDTSRFSTDSHMPSVPYNSIYDERNTEAYRNWWLQIDTSDYVPLELDTLPVTEVDSLQKKRLSITLSQVLTIETGSDRKGTLCIIDMDGRIVLETESSSHSLNIDCSGLNPGVYSVRYTSGSQCSVARIIKQ